MTRNFRHWAYLNDEGMKTWGDLFPDKIVPVLSMIPKVGLLGVNETPVRFYTILWDKLTEGQREGILLILSNKSGASKEMIRTELSLTGLPLRESLTSGSGTSDISLFI